MPLRAVWGFNTFGLVFSYRIGTDIVISQKRGEGNVAIRANISGLKRPDSNFKIDRVQISDNSGPWQKGMFFFCIEPDICCWGCSSVLIRRVVAS
jgi:hypothetical protein